MYAILLLYYYYIITILLLYYYYIITKLLLYYYYIIVYARSEQALALILPRTNKAFTYALVYHTCVTRQCFLLISLADCYYTTCIKPAVSVCYSQWGGGCAVSPLHFIRPIFVYHISILFIFI